MVSWLVIAILVVCALIALKINHLRHKIWIIAVILFALFLYTTMAVVHTQHDLDFGSVEGITDAGKIYVGWLANGFSNLKSITMNAIRMDWASTEGSFFNKTEEIEPTRI